MVYLTIKNGVVLNHTSLAAMEQLDGVAHSDLELSDAEWDAAGGLARVVDGKIVLGKTETELQAEQAAKRITELKALLAGTDYIAVKIAEGSATKTEYAAKIAERQAWRQELQTLEAA
jgi:hypothetical protein